LGLSGVGAMVEMTGQIGQVTCFGEASGFTVARNEQWGRHSGLQKRLTA